MAPSVCDHRRENKSTPVLANLVALSLAPTIPGLAPTIASGWIDDGVRSGIPEEDWAVVVTASRPPLQNWSVIALENS